MALNEDQINKIKSLLATSGWNDVVEPLLRGRILQANDALVQEEAQRTGEYKTLGDNALRARIREGTWLLLFLKNEVATYDSNQRLDELQRQQDGANPQSLAANP